ncbi:YggN family protein [Pseudoalteromonas sp. SCSIO 43095]|uniref:YggN family protein n=1 Tax=Pseudoalteromonas sp. SCSIO 43095 TaxID=2894202 RepID=UPI00202AD84E|nr:YggN family protein [Pseudoalteromonas sp. SCSIO 43095]URQ98689.1 YggN family protein [Pseudoalteromonas sp. SCSIO 43095]
MKELLLVSAIMCAPVAMAHNDNSSSISFSNDECNVVFKNDVRIKPNELEIVKANNQRMLFTAEGELSINGEQVALNSAQRQALTNYTDNLRVQLPEVANIALEGVKIAGVALEEVANAFNIDGLDNIATLMDDIQQEVEGTFYQQGTFVMGQQSFTQFGENFEQQFEQQIETAVESAVMQSMGSILVALGSELMGSGGDMQAFEERMENMGAQIEEKVEIHAKKLEQRANTLCGDFIEIAQQETQLAAQVPALKGYELFTIKQH